MTGSLPGRRGWWDERGGKGLVNKVVVVVMCCRGILSELGLGSEVRMAYFGAWHVDERCAQRPEFF